MVTGVLSACTAWVIVMLADVNVALLTSPWSRAPAATAVCDLSQLIACLQVLQEVVTCCMHQLAAEYTAVLEGLVASPDWESLPVAHSGGEAWPLVLPQH